MTTTTTAPTPTVYARLDAIEASGVAQRFVFFQPRNPVMWIYLWGVVAGAVRMFTYFQPGFANYGGALIGGTVAYAVYTLLWIALLHSLDRFTPVSRRMLFVGFLWGGIASTLFLALTVNTALLNLHTKWFGTSWASDWGPAFTAPFTEETSKAIGFILLLGLAPLLLRSAFDGFIVGAFIGLGFEVVEDVLYVFQGAQRNFGADQVAQAGQVTALRAASGLVSHSLFTAFVCTGIMWILGRDPPGRKVAKGILLILFAMVVHGMWDANGAIGTTIFGPAPLLLMPIMIVLGVIAVLWLGVDAARSERRWAHDILMPEVENGVLTESEAAALSGTHRDRRHFVKSIHGHRARKTAKHVLDAGRDLCAAVGRSGGLDSNEVVYARAEIARLRAKR